MESPLIFCCGKKLHHFDANHFYELNIVDLPFASMGEGKKILGMIHSLDQKFAYAIFGC